MISVIISSANTQLLRQVTENITATIGVPFEIIATDNSKGEKGICEVYNAAAQQAQYNILCFLHEDIIIKTDGWGQVLINIFKADATIGLVGVAGSSYKTLSPSNWGGHSFETQYFNFEQCYKREQKPPQHFYHNPGKVKLAPVACIDGVFMCTTKNIFAECRFDESLFKGFHIYDIDYSINVGRKYKVAVTYDVFLSHLSEGGYNKDWMLDNIAMHNKWNAYLPVNIEGLDLSRQQKIEKQCFRSFINELAAFNLPLSIAYKFLFKNNRFMQQYPLLFMKLYFTLLKLKLKGK